MSTTNAFLGKKKIKDEIHKLILTKNPVPVGTGLFGGDEGGEPCVEKQIKNFYKLSFCIF